MHETGALTVEEAIHVQTSKLARHFGLADRGEIAVGKRAEITVFNLDEIARRDMKKVFDVPDGKGGHLWRWTRDPAPVRPAAEALTLPGVRVRSTAVYHMVKPG